MRLSLPNRQTAVKDIFAYLALEQFDAIADACQMSKPNRIKEWREARDLTLEQLAELSGFSTGYVQRMESGDRNVSLKNLAKLAKALDVAETELVRPRFCQVVGYVGAGAEAHYYADRQESFDDEVAAPNGSTESTVAVEIKGDSLGAVFDGWLVFYDEVRDPPTDDMIGRLCVVGLSDGRVLIKRLLQSKLPKVWNLFGQFGDPILDVPVDWAARVKSLGPR